MQLAYSLIILILVHYCDFILGGVFDRNQTGNENKIGVADGLEAVAMEVPLEVAMRCTRRFTPSPCPPHPVQSVWTYVYDIQNCTERLGCKAVLDYRCNRFSTYRRCYEYCKPLNYVYNQILTVADIDKEKLKKKRKKTLINIAGRRHDVTHKPISSYENYARPILREESDYRKTEIHAPIDGLIFDSADVEKELLQPDLDGFSAEEKIVEYNYPEILTE